MVFVKELFCQLDHGETLHTMSAASHPVRAGRFGGGPGAAPLAVEEVPSSTGLPGPPEPVPLDQEFPALNSSGGIALWGPGAAPRMQGASSLSGPPGATPGAAGAVLGALLRGRGRLWSFRAFPGRWRPPWSRCSRSMRSTGMTSRQPRRRARAAREAAALSRARSQQISVDIIPGTRYSVPRTRYPGSHESPAAP